MEEESVMSEDVCEIREGRAKLSGEMRIVVSVVAITKNHKFQRSKRVFSHASRRKGIVRVVSNKMSACVFERIQRRNAQNGWLKTIVPAEPMGVLWPSTMT